MQHEDVFTFLDKPETLETVSFLITFWKHKNSEGDSSILITYGCCFTDVFNKQERLTFSNWNEGTNRLYALLDEYKAKGFKTRKELGIVPSGNYHDEQVLDIRTQLWNLYVEAYKKSMYVPQGYTYSKNVIEQ